MRLRFLTIGLLSALPALAQEPTGERHGPAGRVTGVVWDSIAGTPLADATVQLVATGGAARIGLTAVSDSLGRYSLDGVTAGSYLLGFFHPMLDSLGIEAPVREVAVPAAGTLPADLAIPGPARLRSSICGAGATSDSSALVVGTVRDAHGGAPIAGARVAAEWLEFAFTPKGVVRRVPVLAATTNASGWFALCGLPAGGTITLLASHVADSTDRLQVELPKEGFARRDLFLGVATAIASKGIAAAPPGDAREDSAASALVRRQRRGEGRLRGTVVAAVGDRPLEGAQVGVMDGPATRTDSRGEWTLEQLPMGTRLLEVRAIGFYPLRQPIEVIDSVHPIRVALSTMKAVLDTIRITARLHDRLSTGFEERRRTGMGRYFSAKDVAGRASVFTSSIFRAVQGLRMERDPATGDTRIFQRGAFGWCAPDVYLNGQYIPGATSDDIDGWLPPEKVTGVEIYSEGAIPAQFQRGMTGCGALLIWSR